MHQTCAWARIALVLLLPAAARAAKFYTYVGEIRPNSVLLAWGTVDGRGNTIGRTSVSHGDAEVRFGSRKLAAQKNWLLVTDLQPDTDYNYEVWLGGEKIGAGKVRTWPERSNRLTFFVIGDWGSGDRAQYRVAEAMTKEFEKHRGSSNPVRFVLTTGDNIYSDSRMVKRQTGNLDWHWKTKFFEPYEAILRGIPFYPVLGNHDGNESESRLDLPVYLDNFFFPGQEPARYYGFAYGGLVEFFALDSTRNTEVGKKSPAFYEQGPQFRWMKERLATSALPWKIPYFHHPLFGAGPRHEPSIGELKHFVELFQRHGVRVVFNGHEHNFQFSALNERSGQIRFVVSGAGGELRPADVRPAMRASNIEGWAGQLHFLSVEIEGKVMRITPLSFNPVVVRDASGQTLKMPLVVELP